MLLAFAAHQKVSAQDLQPKKTGLPGRTVWALATSASAPSGTSSVTTFAATDKGLWRSGDNGASWTETSLKNIGVYAVKSRDIGRASTLLVGTERGVLRSTDGGNTWASPEVTTGTAIAISDIVSLKKVFDIEIVQPGNGNGNGNAGFWFAATEKGVYRSNNDGRSWSLVNIDRTADNNEVRGITTEGNTIIVNLWKEGLWRSTNSGSSWSKLTIGNETTPSKSLFAHTGQVWVQQGKQTTAATVSMLFAGAVSGNVWRSMDNGSSWTKLFSAGSAQRTLSATPTGVDAMTASGNTLISGTPNGLAVSNDNGATWKSVRTSLPQPLALAVHNQTLFVGLQSAPVATIADKNADAQLTAEDTPGLGIFTTSQLTTCNADPTVSGFTPASVLQGSGARTISVIGTNFEPTTQFSVQRYAESNNSLLGDYNFVSGNTYAGATLTYTNSSTVQFSMPADWMSVQSRIGFTPQNPCNGYYGPGNTFYVRINPVPTLTDISPMSAVRGGGSVAATITGTNFIPESQVVLNSASGRIVAPRTTYVSATQLQTYWEAAWLLPTITTDSYAVTVENPAPGGGVSAPQTLSIINPTPIAAGLIPAQVMANAPGQYLTITGNGFMVGSQVYLNGQLKSATFSNGSLNMTLAVSDIPTAGDYSVVVTNPAPGGGSSDALTLQALNPAPSITAFSPSPLGLGEDATLTISGGGSFVSGAVAILYPSGTELATTFVNTNTLTATVSGALLVTVSESNYTLRVRNPAPGGGLSAPVTVPVRNAAPSLTGITPLTLVATANDALLTLTGGNFLSGASVLISGPGAGLNTPLVTTVASVSSLTATLPAGIASSVGQYSIIVRNPNSIADSPAQTINIVYPQAQLSSVTPSPAPAQNAAQALTLSGSNFVSGAQVRIQDEATNGQTINQLLAAMVINGAQINATLPQALAERVGRYRLTVDNPSPNAGVSGAVSFDVLALTPTFTALSTTSATMTGAAQTLLLTGTNFVSSAQNGNPQLGTIVEVNGQAMTASVQSATQISLTLPVNLLDSARVLTIRIVNPALTINGTPQGGGASVPRTFTLLYPAPALSALAPQVVTANPVSPTPVAFTLAGTNFTVSSRVLVQRTGTTTVDTLQATPNNLVGGLATSLALTLPATLFTDATTFTLRVLTPYGSVPNGLPPGFVSGGVSAPQTLTVQNPLPAITTLTPAQSLILQTTTVTITGTNFVQPSAVNNQRGTVAYFGATALPTTVVSPTSVQVTIAAALLAVAQNYSITVQNPLMNGPDGNPQGGGTSNAQTFTALNPTALLDSILVPSGVLPLVVSSATRTLSVFGQFIVNGVTITLSRTGGNAVTPQTLSATFVSPTQVTVVIPTAFLAEAGTLSLQAANPNPTGGASNTLSVAIVNPRPRLFALTPTTATISASDIALTLDGGNFLPNSTIFVRGTTQGGADTTITLAPTSYTPANATPTRLTVSVPTTFAALAGTYFVWVQNPAPTINGITQSDTLSFFLRNPLPTLASVTPAIVPTGSADTTVTLAGTNFTPLASVLVNGAALATNRIVIQDRTTILATIPAALMAQATTLNVQITIPAPGGGTSVVRTLTVRNALPVLDSIAPATIAAMRDTIITAYGSGFNLTSQFRLIRGTTTVTLAIVSLPSSGVARLAISSSVIVTLATYQVRVFNSTPGGGTSVVRNLVVQGGVPVVCEFVNLSTTAVVSASNLPAFTVRFRDEFGNLSDAPVSVVNFGETTGASSGTLSLTRSSVGVYTASAKRFYEAGIYSLWIDGFSTTTGTRTFTVTPGADSRVTLSGVPTSIDAGTMLPAFTFQVEDASGNLTDNGIGRLTYTRSGGSSTATIAMMRLSTGVYAVQSTVCTIAGTYTLALSSVTTVNTLGNRTFIVVSGAAVRANFTGVTLSMNAGALQSAFDVRFYDQYGNYTDNTVPTSVLYTNTTNATNGVSTGTVALVARTGIGLYDAARVALVTAGNYTLAVNGFLNTGHRFFAVKPLAVTKIVFQPFTTADIVLGDVNALFTVKYSDRYNNGSEPASFPAAIEYEGTTLVSTGTIALERITTATGVLPGIGKAKLSALAFDGEYLIRIPGAVLPVVGIQKIRIIGREPSVAVITGLPENICNATSDIDIFVTYRDLWGNLTNNYPNSVRFALTRGGVEVQNGLLDFVGEVIKGVRHYRLRAPFLPGVYTLWVPSPTIDPQDVSGTLTMEVCSPPASLDIVSPNLAPAAATTASCITAGQSLNALTVRVLDAYGLPTFGISHLNSSYTGLTCVSSGTMTLVSTATRGVFVEAAPPTVFTTAGTYRLSVSTSGNFALTTLGTFCVEPDVAVFSSFATIPATAFAGVTLSTVVVRYFDRFGNLTDNGITPVLAVSITPEAQYVLAAVREMRGVYRLNSWLETSGTYTLGTGSIPTLTPELVANRTVIIAPTTATRTEIASMANENTNCTILQRQTQDFFTVRFRDRFGNLSETLTSGTFPPPVRFDKLPYYDMLTSTGTVALNRTGFANARAAVAQQFLQSGNYRFSIAGMNSTSAQCTSATEAVQFRVQESPGLSCQAQKPDDPNNVFPNGFGNVPIGSSTFAALQVFTYSFPTSSTVQTITISTPFSNTSATLFSFTGAPGSYSATLSTTASTGNGVFRVWVRITPKLRGSTTISVEVLATTGLAAVGFETQRSIVTFQGNFLSPSITTNAISLDFGTGFTTGDPMLRPLTVSVQHFTTSTLQLTPPTGFELGLSSTGTFTAARLDRSLTDLLQSGAVPSTSGSFILWVRYAPSAGTVSGLLRLSDELVPHRAEESMILSGASSVLALSPARLTFGADEMTTRTADKTYTISHTSNIPITIGGATNFSLNSAIGASSTATATGWTLTPIAASGTIAVTLRFTTTASATPLSDVHTALATIVHSQGTASQALNLIGTRLPAICSTCNVPQTVTFQNDRFRVNGADFFPLGWYGGEENIQNNDNIPAGNVLLPYWNGLISQFFPEAANSGPRTPYEFIATTRLFLNGLNTHNKRGIIHIPTIDRFTRAFQLMEQTTAEDIDNWAKVIAADAGIRNHSAMLGWYAFDEPEYTVLDNNYEVDAQKHSLINFRSLSKLYQTLRTVDPTHPAFMVAAGEAPYRDMFLPGGTQCLGCNDGNGAQLFDVFMQDDYVVYPCFPDPSPRLGGIPERATLLRDVYSDAKGTAQNVGSTIFVTQGFGDIFGQNRVFAWENYGGKARTPTFNEMRYAVLSDAFTVQDANSAPAKARNSLGGVLFFEYSLAIGNAAVQTNSAQFIAYMGTHISPIIGLPRANSASISNVQPMGANPPQDGSIDPIFREDSEYYYLILINSAKDGAQIPMQCNTQYSYTVRRFNPETMQIEDVPVNATEFVSEHRSRRNFAAATVMPIVESDFQIATVERLVTSGMTSAWVIVPNTSYSTILNNGRAVTTLTGAIESNFGAAEVKVFRFRKGTIAMAMVQSKHSSEITASNMNPLSPPENNDTPYLQQTKEALHNLQCTPNPAGDEAILSFTLAQGQEISVRILDVLGREVARPLERQYLRMGEHSLPLSLDNLPSGTFRCHVITNDGSIRPLTIIHHN